LHLKIPNIYDSGKSLANITGAEKTVSMVSIMREDILKTLIAISSKAEKKGNVPRKVSASSVYNIINAIYKLKSAEFWHIVKESGEYTLDAFKILLALMEENFVKRIGREFTLSTKGKQAAESIGLVAKSAKCNMCTGKTIIIDILSEIRDEFEKICSKRPRLKVEYDQAPILPSDALSRVAFMIERGDVSGKDIIVLGDDDLVSVALALTELPNRIVVLDIDEELIKFIREHLSTASIKAEALTHDLRYPLPDDLRDSFDVFFTDPPDTTLGLILFLSRGAEALIKEEKVRACGYFCMTHADAPIDRWYKIEKTLLEMGFVITDIIRDFNTYYDLSVETEDYIKEGILEKIPPPTKPWYVSSLIRIEGHGKISPAIKGTFFDEKVYDYLHW